MASAAAALHSREAQQALSLTGAAVPQVYDGLKGVAFVEAGCRQP